MIAQGWVIRGKWGTPSAGQFIQKGFLEEVVFKLGLDKLETEHEEGKKVAFQMKRTGEEDHVAHAWGTQVVWRPVS